MPEYDSYKAYIKNIDNCKKYTEEDLEKLDARIISGDNTARKEYITANLRLVIHWATIYAKKHKNNDIMTLISAGNLGLIQASKTYDPTKGKFTTHATPYIKKYISDEIHHKNIIRIPRQKYWKLRTAIAKYTEKNGTEPTPKELANILGTEEQEIINIINSLQKYGSLNEIADDFKNEIQDSIPSDYDIETEYIDKTIKEETRKNIMKAISELNEKEQTVILEYFGFNANTPKTLQEIAAMLNLSHQRVCQIKKRGTKKLTKILTNYQTY